MDSFLIEGRHVMNEEQRLCEHLGITDEGICLACGVNISSDEFLDSLPDIPKGVLTDDLVGIVQLAQATAEEILSYRDPHNPSLNKISWVGTQLMRVPEAAVMKEVLPPSYIIAKEIGYRGTYQHWCEFCREAVENHSKDSHRIGIS